MTDAVKRLGELLHEAGATVQVGLRAQGKLDTVAAMRAAGDSWEAIGRAIGWAPQAVERWYEIEGARQTVRELRDYLTRLMEERPEVADYTAGLHEGSRPQAHELLPASRLLRVGHHGPVTEVR